MEAKRNFEDLAALPAQCKESQRRISACLAACEGISTAGLEAIVAMGGIQHKIPVAAGLVRQLDELQASYREASESAQRLQLERDELLAALKAAPEPNYERLFTAAVLDLAAISENLGLDADEGGAVPIIEAIDDLRAERDKWVDAGFSATAVTQPDDELTQALQERDEAEDMADQLAAQIAAITGHDIGEHSSANDPWRNAMLAADEWITADLRRMLEKPKSTPVYWYRQKSDGGLDGPLHDAMIDDVRKRSGAWIPLYAGHTPRAQANAPSDDELIKFAGEEELLLYVDQDDFVEIARALLARYGSAQADADKRDSERLDFLIDNKATVFSDPDSIPGYWLIYLDGFGDRDAVQIGEYATPRAAIDAALKKGGAA